jgi:hypothetical protein
MKKEIQTGKMERMKNNLIYQTRQMRPGRSQERSIEEFWISVYNSHYRDDLDSLQARGQALAEYLHLLDEINEAKESPQYGSPAGVNLWKK